MYLFPADFNSNSYIHNIDCLVVDMGNYSKELTKVEDKIKELRVFEEKVIWLIKNIDYALINKKDEFIDTNEKYKKLKELYFDTSIQIEVVRQAYDDFENDIYNELNTQILEIQKEIYSNLDKKIIIKNVYVQGNRGYYNSFSEGGSQRAFDIFKEKQLNGIVNEVEGKDNIKYIKLNTFIDYSNINERRELLWILGLYLSFILLLSFSSLLEIYKKLKLKNSHSKS